MKRLFNGFVAFGSVLVITSITSCSNPADNVPEAKVSSATNANAEAKSSEVPAAGSRSYVVNPENSAINFVGSKVTGSHNGSFKNFVGELRVANGKLIEAGNKVVIDMTSIEADNARLTGHLKSKDFFNVSEIPTAIFETISIAENATNSTVTGNLTLHGVTKQISFPATIRVSDEVVEVAAEFFINRFDFDIKYPGKPDDMIRKEVVLKLNVKAKPGTADFKTIEKSAPKVSSTSLSPSSV
jgi:polyisoprenoid-binding protein YceI